MDEENAIRVLFQYIVPDKYARILLNRIAFLREPNKFRDLRILRIFRSNAYLKILKILLYDAGYKKGSPTSSLTKT